MATFRLVVVLLCALAPSASGQRGGQQDADRIIGQIIAADLARCHSSVNGVRKIEFVPSTDAEVAQIRSLGTEAIPPLAAYLKVLRPDGFTQLFAVRFLTDVGGSASFNPLALAFSPNQWEVTRAAALDGMFAASPLKSKPYVIHALSDPSSLIRKRASLLSKLYVATTSPDQCPPLFNWQHSVDGTVRTEERPHLHLNASNILHVQIGESNDPNLRKWSRVKGLAADVLLDRDTYQIGEDIPLHIAIANFSATDPIYSWDPIWDPCISVGIEVLDNTGKPLPESERFLYPPVLCNGHGFGPRLFERGKITSLEWSLKKTGWLPKVPGTFTVALSWRTSTGKVADKPTGWQANLTPYATVQATVTIHIVSPEPKLPSHETDLQPIQNAKDSAYAYSDSP